MPSHGTGPERNCPIRTVLDRVGVRWSMLVLFKLGGQQHAAIFRFKRADPGRLETDAVHQHCDGWNRTAW